MAKNAVSVSVLTWVFCMVPNLSCRVRKDTFCSSFLTCFELSELQVTAPYFFFLYHGMITSQENCIPHKSTRVIVTFKKNLGAIILSFYSP